MKFIETIILFRKGEADMIKLYTQTSCHSSLAARQWLSAHDIAFEEKNFSTDLPTVTELKHILSLTENGLDDIISKRSKYYSEVAEQLPQMKLNDALKLLSTHPKLLRRPIIVSVNKIQIGFNADDIRQFIPRAIRRMKFDVMLNRYALGEI